MSEPLERNEAISVSPLEAALYDEAMQRHLAMTRARVEGLYNLHRAVFAEQLVAVLLGAEVVEDPANAWDLEWRAGEGEIVRVQVKASGERLPKHPTAPPTKARWVVGDSRTGWDHHRVPEPGPAQKRDTGYFADLYVLCRHTGWSIDAGWSFRVALAASLEPGVYGERDLDRLGIREVLPGELREVAARVVEHPGSSRALR
jgi:hypothetical protein